MAARALLRDMHTAGYLDNHRYYGELQHYDATEVNGEQSADAYEEQGTNTYEEQGTNAYEETDGDTQEEYADSQEEDEYADMPALIPFTPQNTA